MAYRPYYLIILPYLFISGVCFANTRSENHSFVNSNQNESTISVKKQERIRANYQVIRPDSDEIKVRQKAQSAVSDPSLIQSATGDLPNPSQESHEDYIFSYTTDSPVEAEEQTAVLTSPH